MKKGLLLGVLALALILLGAAFYFHSGTTSKPVTTTNSGAVTATDVPRESEVAFSVLDEGVMAPGAKNRKNYAIYDPTEYVSFWKLAHADSKVTPPKVDFSKQYVIAVFAGKKPAAGYAIAVAEVKDAGAERNVEVQITEPESTCASSKGESSPYQFIAVPVGSESSLAHTDVTVKKPCK